ncbi:hypothetical protein [Winogradskyella endarachnes]|uniref:Outer membrane beta-barrel protein n=1 Tax=Winogradskyella endarachnes TaxID=2681965 RepID=A0A6L6U9Q7_9FLAO|nr:hypothetical protein [Winogradskyella endarachnes]MUU79015.1 hypothetical protein [Winogradskyella endarachnes]
MKEKKNIDRLFQEKFKDFEAVPNDAVWERISENLPKKKKKRRVIALWWQLGGVAAAIAIMLTVGVSVFNNKGIDSENLPIVDTDNTKTNSKPNNASDSSTLKQKELNSSKKFNTSVADTNNETENELNVNDFTNKEPYKKAGSNPLPSNQYSNNRFNSVVADSDKNKASVNTVQKQNQFSTITNKEKNSKVANEKTSNSTLKSENKAQLKSEVKRKSAIKNAINNNETVVAENEILKESNKNSSLETENKTQLKSDAERKSAIKNAINRNETAVVENNTSKSSKEHSDSINETKPEDSVKTVNELIEDSTKESIEKAIAENTETIIEEEEDNQSRWSIAPNVAPVYFNSLGKGSSLDKQFNDNEKSSDVNMSYGIAGSYNISKKLKIRAGINSLSLNQATSDVYAFTGAETAARGVDAEFRNITFNGNEQHVSLMSTTMLNRSSTPELFNTKSAGIIDQKFSFIEIPLELEYRVLDKKFGINVIGGFSTFFLSNNEIYADVNGSSTLIGEANNINDTSFSANFGLGMDYSLSKQWNINLEPTFKYQINTFNNTTGDFKPFFIGVYTGLSYKF